MVNRSETKEKIPKKGGKKGNEKDKKLQVAAPIFSELLMKKKKNCTPSYDVYGKR